MDDSCLSLQEYWLKHRMNIAALRKWENPKGTMAGYNYRMKLLATAEPELITIKPIKDLILVDILKVIEKVQAKRTETTALGKSTLSGCGSLIRDILGHAELAGLPVRNLNKYENTILNQNINELCSALYGQADERIRRTSAKDYEKDYEEELEELIAQKRIFASP